MSMAYFEYLDQIELMNEQEALYESINSDMISDVAKEFLVEENLNVLYYLPKEK
jgi:hypothetical protein